MMWYWNIEKLRELVNKTLIRVRIARTRKLIESDRLKNREKSAIISTFLIWVAFLSECYMTLRVRGKWNLRRYNDNSVWKYRLNENVTANRWYSKDTWTNESGAQERFLDLSFSKCSLWNSSIKNHL